MLHNHFHTPHERFHGLHRRVHGLHGHFHTLHERFHTLHRRIYGLHEHFIRLYDGRHGVHERFHRVHGDYHGSFDRALLPVWRKRRGVTLGAPPIPSPMRRALVLVLPFLLAPLAACQQPGADAADAALARGDSAMNRLAYADAARLYGEAVEIDPDRAEAYSRQGLALWAAQRFEDAVPVLTRAIELDPDDARAHYYRGASHLALDDFGASVEDLQAATDLGSLHPEDVRRAHHLRAVAHMNLEDYEAAIAAVTDAIASAPDHAFYRLERARLYDFTGRHDAAIEDYAAFLQDDSAAPDLRAEAEQRLEALRAGSADMTGG